MELKKIKCIIFDKRLKKNEYFSLLRCRSLQIKKNTSISDFKNKILRCIEYSIEKEKKEQTKIIGEKSKDVENDNLNDENDNLQDENNNLQDKNHNMKDDVIQKEGGSETEEKIISNDKANNIINNKNDKNYKLYFYLLEKSKKNILMEICFSYKHEDMPQFETVDIESNDFVNDESMEKFIQIYDKQKHILIIEVQHNDENLYIKSIKNKNNCSICQKTIDYTKEEAYKCNICHFSLFCSEECAKKDKKHLEFDELLCAQFLTEEFDLKIFLQKNLKDKLDDDFNKGIVGLDNLGNTCYLNSTIQCLSNTYDLTKYFILKYFQNDINRGNKLGSNGSIANAYYDLINKMWCGESKRLSPDKFIEEFGKQKKNFSIHRQQDAHEFLSILLDQLHEDLNRISNN